LQNQRRIWIILDRVLDDECISRQPAGIAERASEHATNFGRSFDLDPEQLLFDA
jgi:hypothetical protein